MHLGKTVLVDTVKSKFAIPSRHYPLYKENTLKVFHHSNTEWIEIELDKINEAIDAVPAEIGRCYTNIENLAKECKKRHIKIDTYVGWLFIGNGSPIHHSWAVYKNKHIIDFSTNPEQIKFIWNTKGTKDEVRQMLLEYDEKMKDVPLKDKILNGQSPTNLLYVGSKCPPAMGKLQIAKLLDQFGGHRYLVEGTNEQGQSLYQQQLAEKNGDLKI